MFRPELSAQPSISRDDRHHMPSKTIAHRTTLLLRTLLLRLPERLQCPSNVVQDAQHLLQGLDLALTQLHHLDSSLRLDHPINIPATTSILTHFLG
jgi:hypothetical protein